MGKVVSCGTRPSYLQIDRNALRQNVELIRQMVSPAKFLAVIKANAYGHGIVECARDLAAAGVEYFGVALVDEVAALRAAGITTPTLVFGGILTEEIQRAIECDADITVSSIEKLELVSSAATSLARDARIHVKIDTGMNRIGVRPDSAPRLIEAAFRARGVRVVGVYSHFASADEPDDAFTCEQFELFLKSLRALPHGDVVRHIANSGAVMQYPHMALDMVRVGIALYGVAPSLALRGRWPLKPVLSLHSRVVYFKVVRAGSTVSYGRTWSADRDTRIVTIPVGYGDGFPRTLSNRCAALVRGVLFPQVGTICMDQLMVSIGWNEAYNGDEVLLLGDTPGGELCAETLADLAGINPHALLVGFNARLPRVYV